MGDPGLIPGLGRSPGEGIGYPLQYPCLENPHGQRSLVDYSPWGRMKLDRTERLSMHICMMNMIAHELRVQSHELCVAVVMGLLVYFVRLGINRLRGS